MRVDADWVKSASARRILVHWADTRPAWLWSQDGSTLIWRNRAARFFTAKIKKQALRLGPDAVPIKGQINRLIRLGSLGRSSLSRVQFLAGDKPLSATTTVTPLETPEGVAALLVGVDAIDPDLLGTDIGPDPLTEALFPRGWRYVHLDADGAVVSGEPEIASRSLPTAAGDGEDAQGAVRLKASPQGDQLVLTAAAPASIGEVRSDEGYGLGHPGDAAVEPPLPLGLPPLPDAPLVDIFPAPAPESHDHVPLSSLFDRLAENESLYGELSAADETLGRPEDESAPAETVPPAAEANAAPTPVPDFDSSAETPVSAEPDVIAAVIEFEDDLGADTPAMFRVTAREFVSVDEPADADTTDSASVERVSRYNFDELSRILTDRVATDAPVTETPVELDPPIEPVRVSPVPEGALINVGAETFILNRLPLGILVFRDQQVLFANRALTDLVGHETVDSLRAAGLTSIFPNDEAATAGPVTQLVRRDGQKMPVTARLQSITWQGRPALLLSANGDPRAGHEIAVRGFAETFAAARGEGFVATDRAGVVTRLSDRARELLTPVEGDVVGKPLSELIAAESLPALRDFLERPARFAETERPSLFVTLTGGAELTLFAEGQSGIVSGYFGHLRESASALPPAREPAPAAEGIDPSMLARVSRGVRRPLNTIIGFADLIRSSAFGTIENHRYVEYARDIKTAGQEIAVLVDELDDFVRLRSGKFAVRPADLDLAALLDSCIVRVRGQASAARVLVRSAISERLSRVHADRASLGQAVLNLLASAIDQTPAGGTVVLSAQVEDDGSVAVNIRDGGSGTTDPGERFVVFRDGVGKDGEALAPVRSSVGLALTRSLVAVNACRLSVDPAGTVGTLFSLHLPADIVVRAAG